jgi:hypothetical protein
MASGAAPAPDRRGWNVLAISLLALYLIGLGVLAVAAPIRRPLDNPLLAAYTRPTSWWPILVQVLLGAGGFLAYYWPRRHETRSFSLLLTTGLAATTLILGYTAYWNCHDIELQSPFWTPLTLALNLFVGNVELCDNGAYSYPLALQMARLFGLLLLAIAALGIAATVFRAQADRVQVRSHARWWCWSV